MHTADTVETAEQPAGTLAEGPPAKWLRPLPFALPLFALALRLWRVEQNGYGTEYYTAGVRSMTTSWHNFFFNSFDPAGFVSVDKPPVALWIQVASVKIFGLHALSVLLPQVLEGVAAVAVLYHLVQRRFGMVAGLLAGLFLAITPVSVAIDRSSNTDSCLVLVLLLAAWALTRAAEAGSRGHLLIAMALVGLGFNVKMLAAFVVLPTFVLVYLVGAPVNWRRRLLNLTLAGVVLTAVSLSWVLAYDLTPPDKRPFAGSSKENSMLELAIGHNGIDRFVRRGRRVQTAGTSAGSGQPPMVTAQPDAGSGSATVSGPRAGWRGLGARVPAGALRLADRHLAGQVLWLFPLAITGAAVAALKSPRRWPLAPTHLALVLWSGWALTYGIVYSYAGGIFHPYYLVTMAPPLAALAGIAVVALWSCYLGGGAGSLLLPGAVLLTALWQSYVQYGYLGWKPDPSQAFLVAFPAAVMDHLGDWRTWFYLSPLRGALVVVIGLTVARLFKVEPVPARSVTLSALAVALIALLVTPAVWALSTALTRGNVMFPSASPSVLGQSDDDTGPRLRGDAGAATADPKLIAFLTANRRDERYLLATLNARQAAPIIVRTGEPVMAIGGFMGSDPILTLEQFARLAGGRQVRFVMIGGLGGFGRPPGAEGPQRALVDWVKQNGLLVDPALWRSAPMGAAGRDDSQLRGPFGVGTSGRPGSLQLYDLRPTAGLVPVAPG
jgi:4-amino-4-deoxy-L-arabinose transferase-like glycosyltransferase